MTADPQTMMEEYAAECIRREELLNIREIDESDGLSFGEGPVYTHFGGIEQFQFRTFIEVFVWGNEDQAHYLDDYGLDRHAVKELRRL